MSANNFSSNVPTPPHKQMDPRLVGYITCFTWLTVKQAKAEHEHQPSQSVLIEQHLQTDQFYGIQKINYDNYRHDIITSEFVSCKRGIS